MRLNDYFPASYEASRLRFKNSLNLLSLQWPKASFESRSLGEYPDLSTDWIWAEPREKKNLVIISTAEHGIEGYVGAAMMKVFIEEFAPHLLPRHTGLLLIHALNPWGMNHNRKVNENNVDLNRNFVLDENFDPAINPEFHRVKDLINPQSRLGSFPVENLRFWGGVLSTLFSAGIAVTSRASLLGQHHTPNGFFYGGTDYQESTRTAMQLYRCALESYQNVVQLDMHTGYGPRYQMSVIISPLEDRSSAELSEAFNYPLVLKINAEEFYDISGDMGEYFYRLRDAEFPEGKLFSCGFEFGTFGESLPARIRSLRAMTFENQLHWHGTKNEKTAERVRSEFRELYFPAERKWREKALVDGRQAFEGILKAYGLI